MTFLLAHLSDVHLGPVPQPRPLDLVGKRLAGYMNWKHARVHTQNMDVLALIVADMKAQSPDHIAITGDIVNIALPAEFPLGRQWIESIGSGENVSFVPGNHDAYVASAMQDLETTFAPWTLGETSSNSTYPYLRVKEHVALIGLTSGVPTPPFMASGTLGRAQMEACETLLKEAGARGLARVVMLHHPPHKTGASVGRGLTDASAFEAMIRRTGAELILHGHNHRLSVAQLAGPKRAVPVVGVASGSAIGGTPGHRAGYNLFEIERAGDGFKIAARMRGLLPQADTQAHVIGGLGEIALQAS